MKALIPTLRIKAAALPVIMISRTKVNPLGVLKKIKGDTDLKTIPVVRLSSSGEAMDLAECYRPRVTACVVKPVDFSEFMRMGRQAGVFWASFSEPPTPAGREMELIRSKQPVWPEKGKVKGNFPSH